MNYEQKYNEVLQKAKEEYNRLGELGNESMKRRFEIIFPELHESEDERIREEIITYFDSEALTADETELLYFERWIAYLEKQKEQKHPNGCFTCDEYKKGYEAGRLNGFTAGYNKAMKEQKPDLELIQRSWYMDGYIDGEFKREPRWNLKAGKGGPKYEENEKYGQPLEQKEWSDEDLPKWKKTKPERGKAFGAGPWYPSGLMHDNGKHIVFFRGYEISVDELFDKLPKED